MALTIDQKIAQKEAELARLRNKSRALENGQKIILGGMVLAEAKRNPKIRQWLVDTAKATVKRGVDLKRLAPLLDELAALGES
ncbi:hypothetical protein ACTXN4_27990 [Pseudomonas helleri]|uniref:hypothetical protein n=1 Tax=Pseudomonas helleri TaxID=1608996 RepID=UPI003FD57906